MNRGLWGMSLALLIAGLIALCAGLAMASYRKEREALQGRALASVVDLIILEGAGQPGQFRGQYHPVFEYYAEGKLYKQVYPKGSYPSEWKIGDRADIRYDRQHPEDYELLERQMRDFLPQIIYGAGIAMICIAAILFMRFALG